MARLRLEDREPVRAFWRGHSEAWKLSRLNQREYCELHGISLKSFGNWRGQLKREAAAGSMARWGRYPRLRYRSGPISRTVSKRAPQPPATEPAAPPGGRRQYSEDAKRRIVEETGRPNMSVSAVARRYGIRSSLLFRWRRELGAEPLSGRATFVQVTGEAAASMPIVGDRVPSGIEIVLSGGRRLRFAPDADPEAVKRMISALEGATP